MYEELKKLLEDMVRVKVDSTVAFRAMIQIRDELASVHGFSMLMACRVAAGTKIELPSDISDQKIRALVVPFCAVVDNLWTAMREHDFNIEDVLPFVLGRFELTLEE